MRKKVGALLTPPSTENPGSVATALGNREFGCPISQTRIRQGNSVADLGFARGGCANPKGGAPTYYLPNFSRKLHENREILVQRWGRASLRSATGIDLKYHTSKICFTRVISL